MTHNTSTTENDASVAFFMSDDLQQMAERFAVANHIYAVCYGKFRGRITNLDVDDDAKEFLGQYITDSIMDDLLSRIMRSSLEDVIEADGLPPFIKLYAISLKVADSPVAAWLVSGVIAELVPEDIEVPQSLYVTDLTSYEHSVGLIETVAKQYMKAKLDESELRRAAQISQESSEESLRQLRRTDTLTRIMSLIDSEESFSSVSYDILREAMVYANVSYACLLRLNKEGDKVDNLSGWCKEPHLTRFDNQSGYELSELPFFNGKPYTISTGTSLPAEFRQLFDSQQIRAGVFLPINVAGELGMYLVFLELENDRSWSVDDIKFFNEIRRVIQNILMKRITRNSLASSYASLEGLLEHVGCGIRVVDIATHQTLYCNQTYNNMFADKSLTDEFEESFWAEKPIVEPTEYRISGSHYEAQQTDSKWVDGRKVRLVTIYDITKIKQYQEEIEQQASRDYLTGLNNRMKLERDLMKQFAVATETGMQGALFYIDIDDFKQINESLGHQWGDTLLREIGERIKEVRGTTFGTYRVGGDEFAILLSPLYFNLFDDTVEQIHKVFDKPWLLNDSEYFCSASIGVARFPRDADNAEKLIQKVDIALYEAKRKGKNRMEFYAEEAGAGTSKRINLEHGLKKAVHSGCNEFEVYFQPITDVSGTPDFCCGAEALVRWNSPNLGFVRPDDFISLAEYMGLIVQIGDYVLEKSCEHLRYWNEMGHPGYKVNVNLSVVQLLQNDCVDKIEETIKRTGINPNNLTVEVTESLAINDLRRMKKVLADIRRLGVRVALDDFGTGYASLNHIRELPIDVIKIDRCFVMDLGRDEFSDSFVRMMAELASVLDVTVCAEGVEELVQYNKIKENHITLIQGYYFDKPMTAEDFEKKYVLNA